MQRITYIPEEEVLSFLYKKSAKVYAKHETFVPICEKFFYGKWDSSVGARRETFAPILKVS